MEELAELGAIVHTCARHEADLDECLREWKMKGFKVTGSICDASSRGEREMLMDKVSALFNGKLNILVCSFSKSMLLLTNYQIPELYMTVRDRR